MLVNENTALSTTSILLVPYEKSHVTTYHEWMKDEEIQEATASEPLTLEEEYAMQRSWRTDADKLTFIACLPLSNPSSPSLQATEAEEGIHDAPSRMIGDVNLFLSTADEDPEGCIGELELMIAPPSARRQGFGRATILAFLRYVHGHLEEILTEYKREKGQDDGDGSGDRMMKLLQLKVKISSKNEKSIRLFESIGFAKVGEGENYFGEIELVLEGSLEEQRLQDLERRFGVERYRELPYAKSI